MRQFVYDDEHSIKCIRKEQECATFSLWTNERLKSLNQFANGNDCKRWRETTIKFAEQFVLRDDDLAIISTVDAVDYPIRLQQLNRHLARGPT